MRVIELELTLKAVNKDIATFSYDNAVSGVIHTPSASRATVILDGGYVLGEFHCPACALDALKDVQVKLIASEIKAGTYSDYKKTHINSAVH